MPPAGVKSCDALCDWSYTNGIGVYERPLCAARALCVSEDGCEAVALDRRKLCTEAERRSALAHELGHLRTGSLYGPNSSPDEIRRAEYRAESWAARALIPRERLLEAISRGCTEVWQLADRFTVTEKLVRFALDIYGICERVR